MTLRARIAALHDRLDDLFAGASHIEVARKVGILETTVINLRFRNIVPDARQMILIADAYVVSLDWLVLGIDTCCVPVPAGIETLNKRSAS